MPLVTKYYLGNNAGDLECYDVENGFAVEPFALEDFPGVGDTGKAFSADGQYFAICVEGAPYLYIYDNTLNPRVEIANGNDLSGTNGQTPRWSDTDKLFVAADGGAFNVLDGNDSFNKKALPGFGGLSGKRDAAWKGDLLVILSEHGDAISIYDCSAEPYTAISPPVESYDGVWGAQFHPTLDICVIEYQDTGNPNGLAFYDTSTVPWTLLTTKSDRILQGDWSQRHRFNAAGTLFVCQAYTAGTLRVYECDDPDPDNWIEHDLADSGAALGWDVNGYLLYFQDTVPHVVDCSDLGDIAIEQIPVVTEGNSILGVSLVSTDEIPDAFSFDSILDADIDTVYTSNIVTITGIDVPISVEFSVGATEMYRINGGGWTNSPGTISNGDTLQLQAISGSGPNISIQYECYLNSVARVWTIETLDGDTVPDAFAFDDVADAELSTEYSESTTVSGINAAAAISITAGEYSINGGARTSSPGTVDNGDIVTVYLTSSSNYETAVSATLDIGGVTDPFTVTTLYELMTLSQAWLVRVGDGEASEAFSAVAGLYQFPDFLANNITHRDATTVGHAHKKNKFNRIREGAELPLTVDYDPASAAQSYLLAAEGDNDGCNVQVDHMANGVFHRWAFNVLVGPITFQYADANDENAVDQAQFTLTINSDVTATVVNDV